MLSRSCSLFLYIELPFSYSQDNIVNCVSMGLVKVSTDSEVCILLCLEGGRGRGVSTNDEYPCNNIDCENCGLAEQASDFSWDELFSARFPVEITVVSQFLSVGKHFPREIGFQPPPPPL